MEEKGPDETDGAREMPNSMESLGNELVLLGTASALIRLPLDMRGHGIKNLDTLLFPELVDALQQMPPSDLQSLIDSIATKNPLDAFVEAIGPIGIRRCPLCGRRIVLESNGVIVRAHDECPHPNGIDAIFELNVPSGVMVIGNDLRNDFGIFGEFDVQTAYGIARTSLAMAKIGCAHGFVGNSCPGVYRTKADSYIIASSGYDEGAGTNIDPPGERVATVSTNLWWYSIVDRNEYLRRGCDGKYHVELVTVKPGVYRFHHEYGVKKGDPESPEETTVYARFEWVRESDPVKDYLEEQRSQTFTAGQVIANSIANYPTLYEGSDAVRCVAEHIFCVIGGGGRWHPNGFVQYDPDMDPNTPEVDIPIFDAVYDWYPLSESSALAKASNGEIYLNASFLALARNILNCLVRHGTKDGGDESKKHAEELLKKLDALYPPQQGRC